MLRCFRSRRSLIIITGSNSLVAAGSTKDARDTLRTRFGERHSRHNAMRSFRASSCQESPRGASLFHSITLLVPTSSTRHSATGQITGWRKPHVAITALTYRGRLRRPSTPFAAVLTLALCWPPPWLASLSWGLPSICDRQTLISSPVRHRPSRCRIHRTDWHRAPCLRRAWS